MAEELQGADDMMARLQGLEDATIKKWLRKAFRAGAKVVAAALRADAPVGSAAEGDEHPGALRSTVAIRAAKRSRTGFGMIIGWTRNAALPFYAPFVERGTKKMKARNFGKRSFDAHGDAALTAIRESLTEDLEASGRVS